MTKSPEFTGLAARSGKREGWPVILTLSDSTWVRIAAAARDIAEREEHLFVKIERRRDKIPDGYEIYLEAEFASLDHTLHLVRYQQPYGMLDVGVQISFAGRPSLLILVEAAPYWLGVSGLDHDVPRNGWEYPPVHCKLEAFTVPELKED